MADLTAEPIGNDRLATERLALALLDDLLDVPESARAAWIDAQTDNGAVRSRLAAMLEADRIASLGSRGSTRLGTGAAALGLAGPTPLPDRIGQYRITSLIGRGGMGAVYRGTRDADDFDHDAAIKVIKPGLLSEVLHQRFLAERQTLASLTHPNIARLYDGGSTEDGSPFIVMELIEGVPIDIWAGAQNLDTAERVRLVETAAGAIAHAHQRLIVHRDITPLNVLVQEDGTLKLIDFGIARPADAQGTTTATDIAALGRLLKRLVPEPGPELAAIIGRATDPLAPYPSADAFGADLAALRTGRPVAAMGGGRRYRWRKFVGRNRAAVMAGAAALLLLVGGLVAISIANARRAEAEAQAREAELATAPFAGSNAEAASLHATALQAQGDSYGWVDDYRAARPLHQKAEAFIAGLPAALQQDERVRSARSANLRLLGESHHKLKENAQARAALDQAIAVNRSLLADAPESSAIFRKLATSLWYAAGDRDDAGGLQMVALAGDTPGALRSMTSALRTMADNRYNLGDVAGACTICRRAMENHQGLDRRGRLTDFDRNNGMPETAGYLRDICNGGKPQGQWPARPL